MKNNLQEQELNLGVTKEGTFVAAEKNSLMKFVDQIGPITKQAALILFGATSPELVVQRANDWGYENVSVMKNLVATLDRK